MITPKEGDVLAKKAVEDFIAACQCENEGDVANVLMKLATWCGTGICAVVGSEDGIERMAAITAYIIKTQSSKVWKRERVDANLH